jgi:serum/glucocorticoid-regulated kinase 2
LKRCSRDSSNPFVVKLFYSFHDRNTLYLALEFHNGGDLATQLARWGRLGRDRARFYTAEIVEGVAGLHAAGVIYRDLKPENVLISSEGHVVLTDFGLSKDFHHATTSKATLAQSVGSLSPMSLARETTMTFCGTAGELIVFVIVSYTRSLTFRFNCRQKNISLLKFY